MTTETGEGAITGTRSSSSAKEGTRVSRPGTLGLRLAASTRAGSVAQVTSDFRKRKKVWPSSIRSPSWSSAVRVIRPLTNVPFFELASSMIQRSSDLRMTAWVVETQASGTASKVLPPGAGDTRTPSRSDPRPMTTSCTSRRQYRALGLSGRSHCRTRNRCASAVLSSRGPVVALREAVVAVRSLELIMTISPRSRLYRLAARVSRASCQLRRVVDQHRDVAGTPVGNGEVLPPVAIEVAHRNGPWIDPNSEAFRRPKAPISVSQKHRDVAGIRVSHREVLRAVAIEVAREAGWSPATKVRAA